MNIVFDVDGTICFNGQYIEEALATQIKELQQCHNIIFASARPIRDLLPVVKEFNSQLLIGGNGSIVQHKDEIEVVGLINKHIFKHIQQIISQYHLHYIIDDDFNYSSNLSSDYTIFKQLDPDYLAQNISIEDIKPPIKIILVDIPQAIYHDLKTSMQSFSEELSLNFHDNERNIDITAQNINKYTTLIKYLGNEDYIAFGNDINDIQLLNHAAQAFFIGSETTRQSLNLDHLNMIEAKPQLISRQINRI